jgi:hypothetical protein
MTKVKLLAKRVFLGLFVSLTFLHIIAATIGHSELALFADSLGFSPRPDPLTGNDYFEHFEQKIKVELKFPTSTKLIDIDRNFVNQLGGPHRYSVVYLIGLSYAPVHEHSINIAIVQSLFCRKETLNRFNVSDLPMEITLKFEGLRSKKQKELKYTCVRGK